MEKFKFKKKYGQNFLKDSNVLTKIIDNIKIDKRTLIIEIGPGAGALTKHLINLNCDVLCFEIDKEVKNELDKLECANLKVIYCDFLNVNLKDYTGGYDEIYVIANIPYYITTPIIEKIIESEVKVKFMILMVQKEVADRLSANPGSESYGYFSVYLQYYYNVEKICNVSKSAFYPVPKVDSALIKLSIKNNKITINEKAFFNFVKECFRFKRKNIKNNLTNYDLDKINNILNKYNHSLNNRAEDFSLEEFIDLFKSVK